MEQQLSQYKHQLHKTQALQSLVLPVGFLNILQISIGMCEMQVLGASIPDAANVV